MSKHFNQQCAFYFVCKDSDCMKKGAKGIYKSLKKCLKDEKLFQSSRVVKTRCMGACKEAPVAIIGQKWITKVREDEVKNLIKKAIKKS